MISSIIQALFRLKNSPIGVSKKRNNKESMIWLTPKLSQSFIVYRNTKQIKTLLQ